MSWPHVDWSQAPSWATHWVMDKDGSCVWFGMSYEVFQRGRWGIEFKSAPRFGYTGHPRDSLTLRPQK